MCYHVFLCRLATTEIKVFFQLMEEFWDLLPCICYTFFFLPIYYIKYYFFHLLSFFPTQCMGAWSFRKQFPSIALQFHAARFCYVLHCSHSAHVASVIQHIVLKTVLKCCVRDFLIGQPSREKKRIRSCYLSLFWYF